MRIRSNLTSHTLYSEGGKNAGGPERPQDGRRSPRPGQRTVRRTGAGRRVFRLCLLLVLVLLLMQQAADPQVYQRFFAALGAPLQEPALQAAGDAAPANTSPSARSSQAAPPSHAGDPSQSASSPAADPSAAVPLTATVAALNESQRDELTSVLSVHRRGGRPEPGGDLPALLGAVADAARASGEADSERLVTALQIPAVAAPPASPAGAGPAEDRQPAELQRLRDRLQAALDAHYWTSVTDATIWQPGDAKAFYRTLEMGRRNQPALRVGYASLAEQPQVYRGRHVSLAGRAVRVESLQAVENPFGIRSYFLLWVRPDDGSERPVMVYTTEIPRGLQRLVEEPNIADGPALVVYGTFLKRHLYLSQRGSELAPVIVGAVEMQEAPAAAAAVGAGNPVPERGWWIGIAVAVLAAVAFTLWAAWHTGRTGRWRREIRQRGTVDPVPFLQSLDRRP